MAKFLPALLLAVMMSSASAQVGSIRLSLDGEWLFKALAADACKVEFTLSYEYRTHVLEKLVGPVFDHLAHSVIDAFVRRAEQEYGAAQ